MIRTGKFLPLLFLSAALAGCQTTPEKPAAPIAEPAPAAPVQTETDRINAWFDSKYEEELAFSPIQQTLIGRKTNYGLIDDFSEEASDRELAQYV